MEEEKEINYTKQPHDRLGFIYRTPSEERGMFYNGDPNNLKYCYNVKEAREWYETHKDKFITYNMKRPGKKTVAVSFPYSEQGAPTNDIALWMAGNKRADLLLAAFLDEFGKNYTITKEGWFTNNVTSHIKSDDNMAALQIMKDVLLGCIRITPVKVFTGVDRKSQEPVYVDFNELGQDVEFEYEVNGQKYKTKAFGVYSNQIRLALSDPSMVFNGGYVMQEWQRHYNFYRGQFTAIHAPRGGGKTISELPDSLIYLFKEETYNYEKINGIVQGFFSGTEKMMKGGPLKYLGGAMHKILKGMKGKAWKLDKHDGKLYLFDGDIYGDGGQRERSILFTTVQSDDKMRGQRPCKTKFDEAAWYDNINGPEAYGIAIGTDYNEITLLTTINYNDPRNREYDVFMKYKAEMFKNEDLPSLIHRLRKKYGFDRCKSRDDYQKLIDNGVFRDVREEFHSRYKYVALKYTIEDIDPQVKSELKKKEQIEAALQRGENFMLAEYYSEYIESYPEFNPSGLVEPNTPDKYEEVIVGFDEGGGSDNAAVCVGGVLNKKLYIKYADALPRDVQEKRKALRDICDLAKRWSPNGRIKFICTATGGNAFSAYKDAYEAVGQVDMLIKETVAKETAKEFYFVAANNGLPSHHRVGKNFLVKITREEFFKKGNIAIDNSLERDKGLLMELENYKNIKGVYKAAKGKDDQVAAMMFVCLYAYTQILQDSYRKDDIQGISQSQQFLEMREGLKTKKEEVDYGAFELYAEHRL